MRNISLVWLAPGEVISTINQVQGRTGVAFRQKNFCLKPNCFLFLGVKTGSASCALLQQRCLAELLGAALWARGGPSVGDKVRVKWICQKDSKYEAIAFGTWAGQVTHVSYWQVSVFACYPWGSHGEFHKSQNTSWKCVLQRYFSYFAVYIDFQLPTVWLGGLLTLLVNILCGSIPCSSSEQPRRSWLYQSLQCHVNVTVPLV